MGCSSNSSNVSIHDATWNENVDEIRKQLEISKVKINEKFLYFSRFYLDKMRIDYC